MTDDERYDAWEAQIDRGRVVEISLTELRLVARHVDRTNWISRAVVSGDDEVGWPAPGFEIHQRRQERIRLLKLDGAYCVEVERRIDNRMRPYTHVLGLALTNADIDEFSLTEMLSAAQDTQD